MQGILQYIFSRTWLVLNAVLTQLNWNYWFPEPRENQVRWATVNDLMDFVGLYSLLRWCLQSMQTLYGHARCKRKRELPERLMLIKCRVPCAASQTAGLLILGRGSPAPEASTMSTSSKKLINDIALQLTKRTCFNCQGFWFSTEANDHPGKKRIEV